MSENQTTQEQLATIRSGALAQLIELRANPKPTYWLDGQRVLWSEYIETLERTVDWCDRKLAECQPFEVRTEGTTG
ncbi:MAG: hypothetical protein RH917_19370 [Lacipirellulaceae bacterium]